MTPNAILAGMSQETNLTATLPYDFDFSHFDANKTVNHSAVDPRWSLGPTGVIGGEGHYGLTVVGDGNVQNCNESVACCDGYNASVGDGGSCPASAATSSEPAYSSFTCSAVGTVDPHYVDAQSGRSVPYSSADMLPGAAKMIFPYESVDRRPVPPTARCGPALRLAPSAARMAGSVWYARQMNVREGFETTFTFRIAEGSLRCNQMDDAYTHCRARGGDGLALVVQNQSPRALGAGGAGLGYTGITNSLAIEFDTYYNAELLEPYENHVSVHTRGWRHPNSANQSFALASSVNVRDLGRDEHAVRIVYKPFLEPEAIMSGRFEASAHVAHFMENADFANGGQADFGTGMGQLEVYVDDLVTPLLITPLNLDGLLDLHHGRAWIGFSGSTGHATWQTTDLLSWRFTSLRADPPYTPPPVVNGVGGHSCADGGACVHH